ncbi:hypothetical protein O6H91_01G070900 [Diphasiastrum complanatum]|uniref:Uncharacterized protein n=1 Tax=Diphasiastrum complanatum TaxID=34168 RepID=A0ACC2ES70_DIPCM|nr:hypothetical protein O6H91_01G070900 [Diphasiastrum complanatum]
MFFDLGEFLKKIEDWLTGEDKQHSVNVHLDPVLLVPGIGGSILNAVTDQGGKEHVWVRLFNANDEFQSKLWSLFDPSTGTTKSLCPDITIDVPDDRYGLYCCDILDPGLLIRLNVVYYFHDLIQKMLEWGYEEGSTLFGFGYDFRQSNRLSDAMDGFKLKLETIYEKSDGKKVNVISHSMGGLVVKSFMALHGEIFEKCVNSWIAVAAPFQGAPGYITDALLTGVQFVKGWQQDLFIEKWTTHQLLIECPSVYELMSSPQFDWKKLPELQVWSKKVNGDGEISVKFESFGPEDAPTMMKAALKDNTLVYESRTIPLPFNSIILEWANETRKLWHSAALPKGVSFYNLYGTSTTTPFDACYGSEEFPIEDLKDILHTEANFRYVDGDGTVPAESAMLDAVERVGVPGTHRGLLSDERVFRVLKHWLKAGEPDPFYDPMIDYVIIPTMAEFEEHKNQHVTLSTNTKVHVFPLPVHDDFPDQKTEHKYITALVSGYDCNPDARAEAHATVSYWGHHRRDSQDKSFEVSTTGVAEGRDAQMTHLLLEQAIASASEKAIVANA